MIRLSLFLKLFLELDSSFLCETVVRELRKRAHAGPGGGRAEEGGPGTLVTMVASEAEEIGRFVGGPFAGPVLQIGTFDSILGFIAVAEPVLGFLALAVIVPQAAIVTTTQRRVNRLLGERLRLLRRAGDRMTSEAREAFGLQLLADFDAIHDARRRIFGWKLWTKSLVGVLNAA